MKASEQRIPLVMAGVDGGKMKVQWVKLRWDNMVSSIDRNDALEFQFDQPREDILFESFRSQMWVSALASGMAWQQPWLAGKWTVSEVPTGDIGGNGAGLGVALIATASGTVYPQNTVLIGGLNPDGSLGLVMDMAGRVEAAAAAGMKRIIIPNMQRFEVNARDEVVNIPALADKLGLACVLADDLIEATEVLLGRRLPQTAVLQKSPRYPARFAQLLDARVRRKMEQLRIPSRSWPRMNATWSGLPIPQQNLWRKIFRNHDMGRDAYRAGQLYTAHRLLCQAWADQCGMAEVAAQKRTWDRDLYERRANAVIGLMAGRIKQPLTDKNELQSALVLAEENDWIYGVNASVQGAQIMIRQVFDPRSHATAAEKEVARSFLVCAVKSAEVQMEEESFYEQCQPLVALSGEVSVHGRAAGLWPQLLPAQMGKAEILILGLKSRANELGDSLVYDARLSGFVRGFKDSQAVWEQEKREAGILAAKAATPPTSLKVGFVPGRGYRPPVSAVPTFPASKLSDAARCLIWVNESSEVAMLEQKYLHLGGGFDSHTFEWSVKNRVALENMLQLADHGARRGIALARSVGADTAILNMMYELGSNLRASEDNNLRLEGLRQYWRCALMGGLCWQLGYTPTATAVIQVPPPPVTAAPFAEHPSPPPPR